MYVPSAEMILARSFFSQFGADGWKQWSKQRWRHISPPSYLGSRSVSWKYVGRVLATRGLTRSAKTTMRRLWRSDAGRELDQPERRRLKTIAGC